MIQTKIPRLISWNAENVVVQTMNCLKNRTIPSEVVVGLDAKLALITLRLLPAWFREILCDIDGLRYAIPASMKKNKKTD